MTGDPELAALLAELDREDEEVIEEVRKFRRELDQFKAWFGIFATMSGGALIALILIEAFN